MSRVGFLINPIAGMGGAVGLKGTDGVVAEARRRGARPIAGSRALEALYALKKLLEGTTDAPALEWMTVSGAMGAEMLQTAGFTAIEVVYNSPTEPTAQDTKKAVSGLLSAGVDLLLFCGGDGTARDVCAVVGEAKPILGIPAGVKMYSGVFGVTPARTAEVLLRYLMGEIGLAKVEILDLDEERFRRDDWAVRLFMSARTPFEPTYVQTAKAIITAADDDAVKQDIAEHLREEIAIRPRTLFLLGPGSTVQAVGHALRIEKTLLGIDANAGGDVIGKDLAERQILDLLAKYTERKLILSPIGAQGFVLGRGNQPLSPAAVRMTGLDNIIVIATPAKLARTPFLHFDTGDTHLDEELILRRFMPVVVGYHRLRMVRIAN